MISVVFNSGWLNSSFKEELALWWVRKFFKDLNHVLSVLRCDISFNDDGFVLRPKDFVLFAAVFEVYVTFGGKFFHGVAEPGAVADVCLLDVGDMLEDVVEELFRQRRFLSLEACGGDNGVDLVGCWICLHENVQIVFVLFPYCLSVQFLIRVLVLNRHIWDLLLKVILHCGTRAEDIYVPITFRHYITLTNGHFHIFWS